MGPAAEKPKRPVTDAAAKLLAPSVPLLPRLKPRMDTLTAPVAGKLERTIALGIPASAENTPESVLRRRSIVTPTAPNLALEGLDLTAIILSELQILVSETLPSSLTRAEVSQRPPTFPSTVTVVCPVTGTLLESIDEGLIESSVTREMMVPPTWTLAVTTTRGDGEVQDGILTKTVVSENQKRDSVAVTPRRALWLEGTAP